MTEKTEALRLADRCESLSQIADAYSAEAYEQAAAELRRLSIENGAFGLHLSERMKDLARVEAQRDALLEALKEYGWHHEGCPQYPTYTHPDRWPACTCGFDDAIKAVEENT